MGKLLGYPMKIVDMGVEYKIKLKRRYAKVGIQRTKFGLKFKWYGPINLPICVSQEFIILNGWDFMKQLPKGWGLHRVGYDHVMDAYVFARWRF